MIRSVAQESGQPTQKIALVGLMIEHRKKNEITFGFGPRDTLSTSYQTFCEADMRYSLHLLVPDILLPTPDVATSTNPLKMVRTIT